MEPRPIGLRNPDQLTPDRALRWRQGPPNCRISNLLYPALWNGQCDISTLQNRRHFYIAAKKVVAPI